MCLWIPLYIHSFPAWEAPFFQKKSWSSQTLVCNCTCIRTLSNRLLIYRQILSLQTGISGHLGLSTFHQRRWGGGEGGGEGGVQASSWGGGGGLGGGRDGGHREDWGQGGGQDTWRTCKCNLSHIYTCTLHCKENLKHTFPELKLRGLAPNLYINVTVTSLYIPTIGPQKKTIVGLCKSLTDTWMCKLGDITL